MEHAGILERGDFKAVASMMLEDLLSAPPEEAKRCGLRMTSGTSGREPLLLAWGSGVNIHTFPAGAERMLLCQGILGTRLLSLLFWRNCDPDVPARVIVMDPRDMTTEVTGLLSDFAPDRLYGFTFFVSKLVEYLDDRARQGVTSLRFTGDGLSKKAEMLMRNSFQNAEIRMLYSSGETGQISKISCGHLPPNQYHPHDGVTVEIHEPDQEGVGSILISKPFARGISISRYKIGDMGKMLPGPCACGEQVTFEIVGKSGADYLKVGGALLRKEEFDRVAALCAELLDDYFVYVDSTAADEHLREKITLTVYRKSGRCSEVELQEIQRRFSKELFVTATKTLSELVALGHARPLEVEYGGTEPVSTKTKEVKLSRRL